MQDISKLAETILKVASREDNSRHNLVVMLRTDALAVDGTMFRSNSELISITPMERDAVDNALAEKNKTRLNELVQAVSAELGSCSNGMFCLLANVLEATKSHKIVLIESVEYRLDISEMAYVVDFLKKVFPQTTFVYTTGNDLVQINSGNSDVLFVFDDEWLFYDCTEFSDRYNAGPTVAPKRASGLVALLNHCMNGLWTDEDRRRFSSIVFEELPNTEKLLYETIQKNL